MTIESAQGISREQAMHGYHCDALEHPCWWCRWWGPRGHAVYTGWVNAAGLPALALPAAPSAEGLPIGIQLIGRYGSDDELLDLGSTYEARQPWADRWPAL